VWRAISGANYLFKRTFAGKIFVTTEQTSASASPTAVPTRAEQETRSEAERLRTQIETALHAVVSRTRGDDKELDACADRLERAARDLAVALRELARERRQQNSNE
jgi:hypothetical protein